jgi:WD40 repeat protein
MWDIDKHIRRILLHERDAAVTSLAYSPDGVLLASGGLDGTLKLWKAATGTHVATFTQHSDVVTALAFSPDAEWILSGSNDKLAVLRRVPPIRSRP